MSAPLEKEWENVTALEQGIKSLEQKIDALSKGNYEMDDDDTGDAELNELILENSKLKHRLAILNKAIANERQQSMKPLNLDNIDAPISIMNHLTQIFTVAIATAFPELPNPPEAAVAVGLNAKFNDYQCNSSMQLAALLKGIYAAKGEKPPPPRDIATKLIECVPKSPLIETMNISGPGFINIFLSKAYPEKILTSFLLNGVQPPKCTRKRVIVDMSSPNIAKEMHVGHLRSTIIGESISRLLKFLGHDVLPLNHVGDWGTQFGMLIAHLEDKFPNFAQVSPPISDLQAFYKESKARFDSDEEFKKRAYNRVVKLQSGDPTTVKAWTLICDVSRIEFQKIYDRLDVSIIERGESFYQSRMESLIKELSAGGWLEEDEGRKIMWGVVDHGENDVPLTMVKSDGGFTYDTSDMATIKQRIEEEKADWVIYITDAGQAVHFKTIFQCAERLGILNRSIHRVDHVVFGVVLGEDGKKFKTRSGDTVKLIDLMDEGLTRAMDKLKEKGRDQVMTPQELKEAQEAIAYGCIKYADLSHNRINEYVFSFDRMLDDKGNTAVYLLYAFARIKSIARNCGGDYATNIKEVAKKNPIKLEHEKELKLAKVLIKFPDVIERVSKELCPHYLCDYVYEICTTFTEFYDSCYCIEKNKAGEIVQINTSRVLLAECTAEMLSKCYHILGLKPASKI